MRPSQKKTCLFPPSPQYPSDYRCNVIKEVHESDQRQQIRDLSDDLWMEK